VPRQEKIGLNPEERGDRRVPMQMRGSLVGNVTMFIELRALRECGGMIRSPSRAVSERLSTLREVKVRTARLTSPIKR